MLNRFITSLRNDYVFFQTSKLKGYRLSNVGDSTSAGWSIYIRGKTATPAKSFYAHYYSAHIFIVSSKFSLADPLPLKTHFKANLHNHMAQRQFHVNHGFGHEKNKYGGGRANLHPKFHHKLEQEIPIKVNGTLLVGVRKDDRKLYLPNEEGNFKCLNGKQEVLFEKVRVQ